VKLDGKLWIDINGQGTASYGRIRLLELIGETGSIKKAAETLGMSYKTAWDTINTLNSNYGKNLVERKTGGKGGGGTILTDHGRDLIKTYNHYSQVHELYLKDITQLNCIEAVIKEISEGYSVAETSAGDKIACVLLDKDIKTNSRVNLFIKPSDVILVTGNEFEASARNSLKTKVKSIIGKEGKSEIVLVTDKGTTFTTKITSQSAFKLGLKKGSVIYALFKTTSVLASIR